MIVEIAAPASARAIGDAVGWSRTRRASLLKGAEAMQPHYVDRVLQAREALKHSVDTRTGTATGAAAADLAAADHWRPARAARKLSQAQGSRRSRSR